MGIYEGMDNEMVTWKMGCERVVIPGTTWFEYFAHRTYAYCLVERAVDVAHC